MPFSESAKKVGIGALSSTSFQGKRAIVFHPRQGWPESGSCDDVVVNTKYQVLKEYDNNTKAQKNRARAEYRAAKERLDHLIAAQIVNRVVSEEAINHLAKIVDEADCCPIIVYPTPCFDEHFSVTVDAGRSVSTNALPAAYAAYLKDLLGGSVAKNIVQKARVGRTGMPKFARLLWHPSFTGDVVPGGKYILVEDMVTLGGTLAALASYIHMHGGEVIAVTSLASAKGPFPAKAKKGLLTYPLAVTDNTRRRIIRAYGDEFSAFWMEAIGHAGDHITDGEGTILAEFGEDRSLGNLGWHGRLQCLRERLIRVRETGE